MIYGKADKNVAENPQLRPFARVNHLDAHARAS